MYLIIKLLFEILNYFLNNRSTNKEIYYQFSISYLIQNCNKKFKLVMLKAQPISCITFNASSRDY